MGRLPASNDLQSQETCLGRFQGPASREGGWRVLGIDFSESVLLLIPQIEAAFEERANMRSRICYLLLLAVPSGFGQTISGVIHDRQGAGIPGASVNLVARDNTARADAVSDSSGRYRFERVA